MVTMDLATCIDCKYVEEIREVGRPLMLLCSILGLTIEVTECPDKAKRERLVALAKAGG